MFFSSLYNLRCAISAKKMVELKGIVIKSSPVIFEFDKRARKGEGEAAMASRFTILIIIKYDKL